MSDFNLLDPVSPESPCGPDLERQDDPDFLDYYFEAESRLPERYFTPGLNPDGLQGAAYYSDAQVAYAERMSYEIALAAQRAGAHVITYAKAVTTLERSLGTLLEARKHEVK